jgi:hypothetical protein
MNSAATENQTSAQDSLPKIAPPAERKSDKLNFWAFVKSTFMVFLVTKVGYWAGYYTGKLAPASIFPKFLQKLKDIKFTTPLGMLRGVENDGSALGLRLGYITGSVAGIVETWRRWRKVKATQLSIQDIHKDIYPILDPNEFKSEIEQNQRIQDGIQTLVSSPRNIQPRGSYTEAAMQEAAAAGVPTR